jgi:hypothetical protein
MHKLLVLFLCPRAPNTYRRHGDRCRSADAIMWQETFGGPVDMLKKEKIEQAISRIAIRRRMDYPMGCICCFAITWKGCRTSIG